VDAKGAFKDYGERVPDAAPPIDAPIVSDIPDVTGDWYGIAHPPFDGKYFYFKIHFGYTPITSNTGKVSFNAQPLKFADGQTPVGDPFITPESAVGNDATANIVMKGFLPAEANSVAGNEIYVDAVVHSTFVSADFQCGTLTGTGGPVDLQGTTFGAQRMTGDVFPPPISACQ
jgi:hypothetical protein